MPREMTLQSGRHEATESQLEFEIRVRERTAWVSLSGILDRQGMGRVVAGVAPLLTTRGLRIVLDGRGLIHMDYRATEFLVGWNRMLKGFGHTLYLHRWNDYLKAIVVMEDWDRELGAVPRRISRWHHPQAGTPDLAP